MSHIQSVTERYGQWGRLPHTKTRKMSISTRVYKHVFCELKLREYCIDTSIHVGRYCCDCWVGPHVLPLRLTGNHYRDFFYMLCQSYRKMYHWQPQHECGTCMMVLRHIWAVLCEMFSVTLVGTPKSLVYAAPVDNEETLQHRVVDARQTIRNCPGIFERMRRSMTRRVDACIESHGEHSECLLWTYPFCYNLQNKCFQAHVDMDIFSCLFLYGARIKKFSALFSYTVYVDLNCFWKQIILLFFGNTSGT
jgi:hypothetical protein